MKKTAITIGLLFVLWVALSIFPTVAQIPQFPQTLPPNTVVGRTGITAGPAQPIPFGVLAAQTAVNAIPLDSFCTVDRAGAADMGACINTAIAATAKCAANGNTTLRLRGGVYLITTPIVPQSCINVVGDGRGKTVLLTNANLPLAQLANTQLIHFNLEGVTFKDSGSHSGATVLSFGAGFQANVLRNLGFHGYTTGSLMNITANSTVTTFFDTSGIFNSSNVFFNIFEDWVDDDQVAIGFSLAGNLSTPCNTNTATNVVTLNTFKDIKLWGVTAVGWDLVRAADTNDFIGENLIRLIGSGAAVTTPHASFRNIAVQLGDDNATCSLNNDIALERMNLTITMGSPATSFSMFNSGNNNFGHIINFQSDIPTSANLGFTTQAGVIGVNYMFAGRNFTTFLDDGIGNTEQLEISAAKYFRMFDGTCAKPTWGWALDFANGFWRPSSLVTALSCGTSFQFNGASSGAITLSTQAAAGTYNWNWPTTAGSSGQPLLSGGGGATAMSFATLGVGGGGTGDTGTAWTTFTPAFTCGTGTFTVASAKSKTLGKTTWIEWDATISAIGTGCSAIGFTLPNTANSSASVNGQETINTNFTVSCHWGGVSSTGVCVKNGGGAYAVNDHIIVSGVYENQ